MVKIDDLMGSGLFQQMLVEGYITVRPHNDLPSLAIANYTPKAQYEWKWNEVTTQCRGLIFNVDTLEVIARPFPKFFNWDQGVGNETWQNPMPPSGPAIRMEKMDGSLGILYMDRIATRGSFHSEQAEWATNFYMDYLEHVINHTPGPVFEPVDGKTYLFEIIYPENRIVVDYGDYKGLVLIDVIDNETGHSDLQEFDDCKWPDKVKRVHLNTGFDSGQAAEIPPGDEGFVYLWPHYNLRTKMKSAEYVELHRLVSHLSEKSIWEALVAGKTRSQIKDGLPDEFHGFVDDTAQRFQDAAMLIVRAVFDEFARITNGMSDTLNIPRKQFAIAVKDNPLKKYLFLALDGKPIYPVALKALKPKSDKKVISEEDI